MTTFGELWRSLFQRVCNQRQHLLILIQQQHDAQVPQSFITESRASDQFQTFYLTKVRRVAQHVNVEQFGDIVVSRKGVFFLE